MITPGRLVKYGIILYLIPFALSATAALLSISSEPWAYDSGQTIFIIYIYARFYLRWLAVFLIAIGVIWMGMNWFKKRGEDTGS